MKIMGNLFRVGRRGANIYAARIGLALTPDDALNLAAHLIVAAGDLARAQDAVNVACDEYGVMERFALVQPAPLAPGARHVS